MSKLVSQQIPELCSMKTYPSKLSYSGNLELLKSKKISIVGSRRPNKYTKDLTYALAQEFAKRGVCIVSGGAMGVDAIAHRGAKPQNTIAVLPCGINIKYPSINKALLQDIETNGLLLSQFDDEFCSTPWSFVLRNELVVALGEVLIVTQADKNSGSLRSVEFALKMGKEIYVLPHRLDESLGTNELLKNNLAKPIFDIYEFTDRFAPPLHVEKTDDFLEFCKTNPTYEEALQQYPDRVFEAELNGEIEIKNGFIRLST
jgi:DNA processing protein